MAERKRQYATYTDEELGERIESVSDSHEISIAELLRNGAKREIEALEGGA